MFNKHFLKEVIRVFTFAFLAAFLPLVTGLYTAPDWNTAKAAGLSALVGALAAGIKAVVDFFTKGVTPVPSAGVLPTSVKE